MRRAVVLMVPMGLAVSLAGALKHSAATPAWHSRVIRKRGGRQASPSPGGIPQDPVQLPLPKLKLTPAKIGMNLVSPRAMYQLSR